MINNLNLKSLKSEIKTIKGRTSKSLITTNFFNQSLISSSFLVIHFSKSLFFVDRPSKNTIGRFFYFLANTDYEYCINHNFGYDLVCDIVDMAPPSYQLESFLALNSFKEYAKLKKMSITITSYNNKNSDPSIKRAKNINLQSIYLLFAKNFDNFSERPPTIDEIEIAIRNQEIYCKYNKLGDILGFYWNRNKKFLSELKYLFVEYEYRGLGIGKDLLNEYFVNTSSINRKQLWVLEKNISAITLYKNFGYEFDAIVDYIYTKTID
jgi:ribosomal protein S18 acetylase RimI-like enzyme